VDYWAQHTRGLLAVHSTRGLLALYCRGLLALYCRGLLAGIWREVGVPRAVVGGRAGYTHGEGDRYPPSIYHRAPPLDSMASISLG